MKYSKTHIVAYALLIVCLSGCGFGKVLQRNSTRHSERRAVEKVSQVRNDEFNFHEQGIKFRDSSHHDYQVLIFPRDSFSYSVRDGFRGHADRVQILGSAERLAQVIQYNKRIGHKMSDSSEFISKKINTRERSDFKEVTRRSRAGIIIGLAVFVLILVWCLWKVRFEGANYKKVL